MSGDFAAIDVTMTPLADGASAFSDGKIGAMARDTGKTAPPRATTSAHDDQLVDVGAGPHHAEGGGGQYRTQNRHTTPAPAV
jgi:hypothetical protein